MKKLIAILCAAFMLQSMGAWAEPAAGEATASMETVPYENNEYGFSMEIPADWTPMDRNNIDALLEGLAAGELHIESFDASSLKAYAEQIKATNMVMMVAPDGCTNACMVMQEAGVEVTADQFISIVIPNVISQDESTLKDFVQVGEPSVMTYGDHDYAVFSCNYSTYGLTCHLTQAYYCAGATVYCLSFTTVEVPLTDSDAAGKALDGMLNTLTFAAE